MPSRSLLRRPRRGFTLLELALVLGLAALVALIGAPPFLRARDAAAVHAAAGDLASAFAFARQTALNRRAFTIVGLDTARGELTVRTNGARVLWRELGREYGILLRSNRDSAVYDQRGLAYGVSNLTVTVRRGAMVDSLTMSRLGRLR